jgi:two-component system, response regulator YesN
MKILIKGKTFTKYILSYSVVLLIPIILLGIIMYYSIAQLLREQSMSISNEMLISSRDNIDNRIAELNMAAFQISENKDLKKYKLAKRDTSFVNAVETLKSIIFPSEFFKECFIYYFDNDLIYSPSGTYRTSQFIENIYVYEKWTSDDFFKQVSSSKKPVIRPAENIYPLGDRKRGESYFTYVVPIESQSGISEGAVIFTIKHEIFNKILSDIEDVYNGNVIIIDDNYKFITGDYNVFSKLDSILDLYKLNNEQYTQKIKLENKNYIISTVNSSITGWSYISLIPIEEITNKLRPMMIRIVLGFIAVIFLGIVAIILSIKMNYNPIKRLLGFSLGLHHCPDEVDEIERVFKTFEYMGERINTLQHKVDESKPIFKKSLLIELIKGYYNEVGEFNKTAEEAGVKFNHGYFNVIVFRLFNGVKVEYTKIITEIEEKFSSKITGYGFDGVEDRHIVFVVDAEEADYVKLRDALDQILIFLNENYYINAAAYVGDWCMNAASIGNSYLQAITRINSRSVREKDNILFYKDLDEYDEYIEYNIEGKLERLELCILQDKKDNVKQYIYDIFNEMQEQKTPLFLAKSISYNIINYVLALGNRVLKNSNLRKYKYSDIISLVRFDTIDELSEQIIDICMDISSLIHISKEKNNGNKIEKMIEYVKQNYLDCNFSLQCMCEHFNMSVSNLSNYFKANTEENISDYVNRLRIEKAKELLKQTDKSIQDIVYIIGYLNVSSFIRKFKAETGVTPGKFRELTNK